MNVKKVMIFEVVVLLTFFLLMWLLINEPKALNVIGMAITKILKNIGCPAPYG